MKLRPLYLSLLILLTAGLLVPGSQAQDGGTKIGSVDMATVFSSYWKTQEADETLKKQRDIYKGIVEGKKLRIIEMEKEYEAKRQPTPEDPIRSEADRQAREAELRMLYSEIDREKRLLEEYINEKRKSLQDAQLKDRARLLKDVQAEVNKIAEAEKFDIIFDSSGLTYNQIPMLTFASDEIDLTKRLIAILNDGHDVPVVNPNAP